MSVFKIILTISFVDVRHPASQWRKLNNFMKFYNLLFFMKLRKQRKRTNLRH